MSEIAMARKKQIELRYVEEARLGSSIFPSGFFVPHENPDFLVHIGTETLGLEVTELCRERPRREAAIFGRIPENAKAKYNDRTDTETIDVSVAFSQRATELDPRQMTRALADFVYAHREVRGSCPSRKLPDGYCHIGIHDPLLQFDATGRWHGVRAFDVERATEALIRDSIVRKSARLKAYRKAADVVWLLLVNDQFLGAGEVYVSPADLAAWTFPFEFEKVLLFVRQPGGSGTVFDLRRKSLEQEPSRVW